MPTPDSSLCGLSDAYPGQSQKKVAVQRIRAAAVFLFIFICFGHIPLVDRLNRLKSAFFEEVVG
jgi:hypothetical protein